MTNVIQSLHLLAIVVSGWLNHHQQAMIDYLIEENHLLKKQLSGKKLHLTDQHRIRPAIKAKHIGRLSCAKRKIR